MKHELKIAPAEFRAVIDGRKRFEVRRHDRDFKVGDWAVLREYRATSSRYTGARFYTEISYVLRHEDFPDGIQPGYCVFGFKI